MVTLNDDLRERFLAYKAQNDGCLPRTIKAYGDVLRRLAVFLDGRPVFGVALDELTIFTGVWLHKLGVGPRARTPYVACVREFYRWACDMELTVFNPAASLPYPRAGKPLPRMMSLASAEKLMWAPDFTTFEGVRDAAMLALLMGCGLRVSGLTRLDQEDIQPLTTDQEARLALLVTEKGEKSRRLPIPKEADLLLRVYLEHPDLAAINRVTPRGRRVLFVSTMNRRVPAHEYFGEARRLSPKSVWNMIQRYGKQAGIPAEELHPHALRHLFGTELTEDDVNAKIVQQLMGHASPASTELYVHLATRKLLSEIDKGNPLGKIKTPVSELMGRLR